ncbi:hypothetical protein GLOIN_2v1619874, partial [Rhizophagus irregularis DAOM 181602=DAOM 197198]
GGFFFKDHIKYYIYGPSGNRFSKLSSAPPLSAIVFAFFHGNASSTKPFRSEISNLEE